MTMILSHSFIHSYRGVFLCLILGSSVLTAHERENDALGHHSAGDSSLTMQTGWDSRYFTEGRDALDGDSLWRSSLEWVDGPLAWGLWYGNSPEQSYDELQLSVAWIQTLGDFDTYLSYTHLRFPFDGSHDNEAGGGIAYTGCPLGVEFAADIYHSFEADGFFCEVSATRGWDLCDQLSAEVSAVFGVNQGYVADGHDGANHVALTLGLSYAISENLSLLVHGTQSWGVDRKASAPDDASLKDFFHGGVGVEWVF